MFKADGDSKPVGNEGAGVVVDAGSAPEAQDLLGKRVAVTGGSSYAQYTKTSLNNPMFAVLLDDVSSPRGRERVRESPRRCLVHHQSQFVTFEQSRNSSTTTRSTSDDARV